MFAGVLRSVRLVLALSLIVLASCERATEGAYRPGDGRVLFSRAGVDLWVSAPDGSARRQLTFDGSASGDGYVGGRWSPDGSLIAAERSMARESGSALYLLKADGSEATRLTAPGTFLDGYAWSPDGRFLAYAELTSGGTLAAGGSLAGGVGDVHLFDVRAGSSRALGPGTHPAFSPDGATVGFAHSSGSIAAADVATGAITFLVRLADLTRFSAAVAPRGMGLIGGPQWSADGKLVAYAAIENGPILEALQIVYVQEAKPGAPPKQWAIGKTGAVHHVAELRWSPTAPVLGYTIINAQPHHHWIGTIAPDDAKLRPLYDSTKHFLDFAWSPDGSAILLQIDDDDAWAFLRPGSSAVALRLEPGGWRPDWCIC
jgi:dipeptidyl aminopeptidase/acylaminoacyl peptidase